jgi:hypothetical protein
MPAIRTMNALRPALHLLIAMALLMSCASAMAQQDDAVPPAPLQVSAPEFGALAFTADGSFTAVWKQGSKNRAEAKVLADCEKLKRGTCQVVSFRQELCAAIASFRTAKDLTATYAGGAVTRADAKRSALERCNGDARAQRSCQVRTVVCGDGR